MCTRHAEDGLPIPPVSYVILFACIRVKVAIGLEEDLKRFRFCGSAKKGQGKATELQPEAEVI